MHILKKNHAQKLDKNGHANDLNYDKIILNYSPTTLIWKIGFLPQKLNTEQQAVEFTFITKKGNKSIINLKNIILKTNSNKTMDINNPVRDSVYYLSNGELSWNVIHYLNKSQLDFIKQELVKKIILTIDNHPLEIILSKKSQNLFREAFKLL